MSFVSLLPSLFFGRQEISRPSASLSKAVKKALNKQLILGVGKYGAVPLAGFDEGAAAIHLAAESAKPELGTEAILDWMILHGADVNMRTSGEHGHMPLHRAVMRYNPYAVKKLIAAGAEVNRKNALGKTPLDCVYANHWETALILLEHGAEFYNFYNELFDEYSPFVVEVAEAQQRQRQSPEPSGTAESGEDFRRVVQFLQEAGVDLEAARNGKLPIRQTLLSEVEKRGPLEHMRRQNAKIRQSE